jgi:hypothetical protein
MGAAAGQANVHVAFRYVSPAGGADWYIDDVEVQATITATDAVDLRAIDPLSANAPVGFPFFYTLEIQNTGMGTNAFTIAATGNVWPVTFFLADQTTPVPAIIGPMASGATQIIEVRVTAPGGTADGVMDSVNVTVEQFPGGAVSDSVVLTSSALNIVDAGDVVAFGPETFESPTVSLPTGWTQQDAGGTGNFWATTSENPIAISSQPENTGTNAVFYNNYLGPNEVWLVSAPIDLTSVANVPVARFYENVNFGSSAMTHEVLASTSFNGSNFMATIGAGQQWQSLRTVVGVEDSYERVAVNLSAHVSAATYVAFRYAGNFDSQWHIDDFMVLDQPLMPDVTVIPIDPVNATAQTGATFFYTVEVQNTGNVPDTFTAAVAGNVWTVTLFEADQSTPLTNPFTLSPSETTTIEVGVAVPPGAMDNDVDSLTLTVSGAMGSSDATNLTTTAFNFSGGYFMASSFDTGAPSFPSFGWIDISATGTDMIAPLGDDNVLGPFTDLPAGFTFYGTVRTQYWVSSNGWITFTDPATQGDGIDVSEARENTIMPFATEPNDMIAFYWDDLNADDPDVANKHAYRGLDGDGNLVVTFERYPHFDFVTNNQNFMTAQVILRADNNNIRSQVMEFGAGFSFNQCTIGVENAAGDRGLTYHFDGGPGPITPTPMAVEFGTNQFDLPVELSAFGLE